MEFSLTKLELQEKIMVVTPSVLALFFLGSHLDQLDFCQSWSPKTWGKLKKSLRDARATSASRATTMNTICSSATVLTCAASGPHCQSADTHPGHLFAARDLSTNHNAGASFPANGQQDNVISSSTGGASAST